MLEWNINSFCNYCHKTWFNISRLVYIPAWKLHSKFCFGLSLKIEVLDMLSFSMSTKIMSEVSLFTRFWESTNIVLSWSKLQLLNISFPTGRKQRKCYITNDGSFFVCKTLTHHWKLQLPKILLVSLWVFNAISDQSAQISAFCKQVEFLQFTLWPLKTCRQSNQGSLWEERTLGGGPKKSNISALVRRLNPFRLAIICGIQHRNW